VKDKLLCERGGGDRRVAACCCFFVSHVLGDCLFLFFSISVSLLRRIFCFDFQDGNPAFLVRFAEIPLLLPFHAIIIHRLVFLTFLLLTSKNISHTPITLITKGLKDLQNHVCMLDERETQRASPRSPKFQQAKKGKQKKKLKKKPLRQEAHKRRKRKEWRR
jgi:hypothetical protein